MFGFIIGIIGLGLIAYSAYTSSKKKKDIEIIDAIAFFAGIVLLAISYKL